MSLITGAGGRRNGEARTVVIAIYAMLIAGGITMIYPFLIMISGSFKSDVDLRDYDVFPKYFHSSRMLFRKYLESKYNESITLYNINTRQNEFAFKYVEPPTMQAGRVKDWMEFLKTAQLPATWSLLGHSFSVNNRMLPEHARGYRAWLVSECGNSIHEFNRRYSSLAETWLNVQYPSPIPPADRTFKLTGAPIQAAALSFKSAQPVRDLIVASLDGKFVIDYLQLKYGKKIEDYNRLHDTQYPGYDDINLSPTVPAGGRERADWLEFVYSELNLQFIAVDAQESPKYAAFLDQKYNGDIGALNAAYGARYRDFASIQFPEDTLTIGPRLADWALFIREASPQSIRLDGPDFRWRGFLRDKYANDLKSLNQAHQAGYASFSTVAIPAKQMDYYDTLSRAGSLRWEFATRNYRHVVEYLLLHGRGLWNTFVFCALSILGVLIVNPLAAYAMSRYALPSTYKVLLYLLATMAFPPMVTAIPNFLLLKELHLLNTFWALVLPGLVNGYSIFLLKGFFDSIPRDLYEAGQIDGAGEWTMFWGLTMYLSKPILAVISLAAFNSAYGAFMFAFIVCQDEKMWTLMVWLYQLQQYSHQAVTFAALLVASLPTFLVFLMAQRLILRGIVVPIEK